MNIKKDTIVAIFLLLFCGIMINSSFDIEDPGYQGMKASFWPTIVLCLLSIMCLVMLIKSVVTEAESNLNSNFLRCTSKKILCSMSELQDIPDKTEIIFLYSEKILL